VEGFLHWVKEELERFTSVQRATKGEGAPEFGHISLWILWQGLSGACYVYRFLSVVLLIVSHVLIIII
jgi:hypothetical protein